MTKSMAEVEQPAVESIISPSGKVDMKSNSICN